MQTITGLTSHLLSGLGQAALVVILFSAVFRLTHRGSQSQFWLGLLFGLGAAASMAHPIVFAPGIAVDPRSVMLSLAGPFGGPVSAVIAMAIAGLMRVHMGGIGMPAGLLGIAIAGCVGLIHRSVFQGRTDNRALVMLGLMSTSFLLSVIALPRDLAISVLVKTGPWLVLTDFIGIFAIGTLLSYEKRFQDRYAAMKTEVDHDPLTGLYNRRALGAIERRVAGERDRHIAIVLLDIDHFKSVNDTYGHDAGDFVIAQVSKIISSCTRRSDYAIRYGGEEILLVLQGAGMTGAYGLAEAIRTSIKASEFSVEDRAISVTISAGVSVFEEQEKTLAGAIKRADQALYTAKRNGRDRTERSDRLQAEVAERSGKRPTSPPDL